MMENMNTSFFFEEVNPSINRNRKDHFEKKKRVTYLYY